jgi:hypothetical protein
MYIKWKKLNIIKTLKNKMKKLLLFIIVSFILVGTISAMSNSFKGDVNIEGMITGNELNITTNDSIYMGFLRIDNQGYHATFRSDLDVYLNDEPTTYFSITNHNNSLWSEANLVLRSGNSSTDSALNLVKNSPFHPFTANASGLINEGPHGTFVDHNSQISWWHFSTLDKDENGNLVNLSGMQRLMMLNDSSLNLEQVDLYVNGSVNIAGNQYFSTADAKIYSSDLNGYFQFATGGAMSWYDVGNTQERININGVGSYLNSPTGKVSFQALDASASISLSDSGATQLEVDTTDTLFRSPNAGSTLKLNDTASYFTGNFVVNNGTSDKIIIDSTNSKIYSPNGNWYMKFDDTTFNVWNGAANVLESSAFSTKLVSPDGNLQFQALNSGLVLADASRSRLEVDGSDSILVSPDGNKILRINNTGSFVTGDISILGNNNLFSYNAYITNELTSSGTIYIQDSSTPYLSINSNRENSGQIGGVAFDNNGYGRAGMNAYTPTYGPTSSGTGELRFWTRDSDGIVDRLIINKTGLLVNSGNVGIGTNSPTSELHVKGTRGYGSLRISPTSDDGESTMGFFQDGAAIDTNDAWVIGQGGWSNVGDFIFGNLNNGAGGDVRLLIQKDGNVGIGTTSPSAKLDVNGSIKIMDNTEGKLILGSLDGAMEGGAMTFKAGSGTYDDWNVSTVLWDLLFETDSTNENVIKFQNNANGSVSGYFDGDLDVDRDLQVNETTLFVKASTGRVGIGTISPSTRLHLKGTGSTDAVLFIEPGEWDSTGDYGEIRFGDTGHYIRGEHTTGMTFYDTNKFNFSGSNIYVDNLAGSYTGGQAKVCVYDNGQLFACDD